MSFVHLRKYSLTLLSGAKQEYLAVLSLNRSNTHHAFHAPMMEEFLSVCHEIQEDSSIRCLLVTSKGSCFSSGVDIQWLQNLRDLPLGELSLFQQLLYAFNRLEVIKVVLVQGNVYGGALGLVALGDVVVAKSDICFNLSELKLAMIPAMILPFLEQRISLAKIRYHALTGVPISAKKAEFYGLVDKIIFSGNLFSALSEEIHNILQLSFHAQKTFRELCCQMLPPYSQRYHGEQLTTCLVKQCMSPDAQHGMSSFLSKKKPYWVAKLSDEQCKQLLIDHELDCDKW